MNTDPTTDSAALPRMVCCASVRHNAACLSNSAENETQDCAPCPHCGSLKDPWFSRVLPMSYHCQDCGKDVDAQSKASLPAHLREDTSYLQCSKCGRKSWGGDAVNLTCGMTAPSGEKCDGNLLGHNANVDAQIPASRDSESITD